jgi:hypothetical protein
MKRSLVVTGSVLWSLALGLLLTLVASMPALAQAPSGAPAPKAFDHVSTGYPLTGAHANERCESCHVNGVFKGTPKDCGSCHSSGARLARNNTVMPAQHLPTQTSCDSCHDTRRFAGARFSHAAVSPGACQSCHNGSIAAGKTRGHLATTANCDTCHTSNGWTPAIGFDHSGFDQNTACGTCHNGSQATGKPATHMPVGATNCTGCHSTFSWKPTRWNHTQVVVAAQCAACHTGTYPPADGKPGNHIPYAQVAVSSGANCDACHRSGYSTWTTGRFHGNFSTSTQCATCHTGSYLAARGKPADSIHAGITNCENCHNTSGWGGAQVDHASFNQATNCASCHNGNAAPGKPAAHMPVGATNCYACHSVTAWKPTKWNHTQMNRPGFWGGSFD